MMDAISRLVPGVLHNEASAEFESFQGNLLEHPHYSRPEVWHEKRVPEVLLSGHHANIEKWRREQSVIRTAERRPDLLEKADLSAKEKALADRCLAEKSLLLRKRYDKIIHVVRRDGPLLPGRIKNI